MSKDLQEKIHHGKLLQKKQKESGLSQEKFASKYGVSRQSLVTSFKKDKLRQILVKMKAHGFDVSDFGLEGFTDHYGKLDEIIERLDRIEGMLANK